MLQTPTAELHPNFGASPTLQGDGRFRESSSTALLLLRPGRVLRWITHVTSFFLVITIIAMIFVPWQQTSRGYGQVIAMDPQQRPQPVMATAKGVVKNIAEGLREGSFVSKGQVILEIEPFAQSAQQQMELQLAQARVKLGTADNKKLLAEQAVKLQALAGNADIQSAIESVAAARAKLEQSKDKVQGLDASVQRTKQDFDRSSKLYADGFKSQRDFIKDQENFLKAVAEFEEGEQAVIEASKNLAAKEQDLNAKRQGVEVKNRETESKLQEALADITMATKELSETQVKLEELGRRLAVVSPHDGYLHEFFGLTGSGVVKEGDVLFTVVPNATDLAVELTIRGNDVPLLHIDDEVRLQFEGYPAVQFVGWPSAAQGTFGGRIALINPTDDGQGNFRIVVTPDKDQEPWPDNRYLRQGVLANGWVLLASHDGELCRVPLGYEIWRQLNGFPPVVGDKAPDDAKDGKKPKEEKSKIKLPK